jgi:hypothetical protein
MPNTIAQSSVASSQSLYQRFLDWNWDFGALWDYCVSLVHYYYANNGAWAYFWTTLVVLAVLYSWDMTHAFVAGLINRLVNYVFAIFDWVATHIADLGGKFGKEILVARGRDMLRFWKQWFTPKA